MPRPIVINKTIKKFNSEITTIPGDKSVSIRTILLSSMALGKSKVKCLPQSEDVESAIKCCKKLGIQIKRKKNVTEIYGKGINGFFYKKNILLDAGNSATVARAIMGCLIRSPYKIKLIGDASLVKRDMSRIIAPLQEFGAAFYPKKKKTLPIYIKGTNFVRPISWKNSIGSAQVNTAISLAALNSPGETIIKTKRCRDHTEKLFKHLKIPIKIKKEKKYDLIRIKRPKKINSFDYNVPSDPSSAAFFVMLTILSKNSSILIKNCLINENRIGFYKIAKKMGAKIIFRNRRIKKKEKIADIYCESTKKLKSINLSKNFNNSSMIDEFNSLFILASFSQGISTFKGLEQLNQKESKRLDWGFKILKMIGVKTKKIDHDGIKIYGNPKLKLNKKYVIKNYMKDHRIAMNAIILALAKGGLFCIHDYKCINTSFPNFLKIIKFLGGKYAIN
tara:strand:- start:299 stop:1642 length:1344 start_codon:yes stop_codon:yes gene_type:complete